MAITKLVPGEQLPVKPLADFSLAFSNIGPGLEGDFGAESSRIPFLSIGQKTSDITDTKPEALGAIIYSGKYLVPKPAIVTFFGGRQYYKQNLSFDRTGASRPKMFPTKEHVLAFGGNLERFIKAGADDMNFVPEIAAKVAIFSKAKGKDAWAAQDEILSTPIENGSIAVGAIWVIRGVAYGQIAPNLRMIDRALREDGKELGYARFSMNVTKQQFSANTTFVPMIDRLPDDNSPEAVQVLHKMFEV